MRKILLLLSIFAVGCGGSGGGGNSTSHKGRLQSGDPVSTNRYYDGFRFRAESSGPITIGLESGQFDPYLILGDEEGDLLDEDDDSGTGLNALITYSADDGEEFLLVATSAGQAQTGAYTLAWSDNLRKVEQVTALTPRQIDEWKKLHTRASYSK